MAYWILVLVRIGGAPKLFIKWGTVPFCFQLEAEKKQIKEELAKMILQSEQIIEVRFTYTHKSKVTVRRLDFC